MGSDNQKYEVGYGKPPKKSQFQPGETGNAGGRPKGQKTLNKAVQQLCEELVSVTENGQIKQMTKIDIAVSALFAKASKGNVQAIKLLLGLKAEAETAADPTVGDGLSIEEKNVLLGEANWLALVQQAHQEAEDDKNE